MKISKIIKGQERIPMNSWSELVFGGTESQPWLIPFGHQMANELSVSGGKGGNSAKQYTWIEMEDGQEMSAVNSIRFSELQTQLKSSHARVPFSYIATDYFTQHICRKFGVDVFYKSLFDGENMTQISKKKMEEIGQKMKEKLMSIIGNMTDEEFNNCTDEDLAKMGILEEVLAIEKSFKIIELITGQKIVSTRSNGVKEDGTLMGFHGKGKTTLYRINPLEIFRGCLISISSRYESAWQSYVYKNSSLEEKQNFDIFTTEFSVLIMNMVPNQIEGGTAWTVQASSGNNKTVHLQKTVKNGEASVAGRGGADEFVFDKELLLSEKAENALVSKTKGETLLKLERTSSGEKYIVETSEVERSKFLLSDAQAANQALIVTIIDELYGRAEGDYECGMSLYSAGEEVTIAGKLKIENGQPVLYTAQTVVLAEDLIEQYIVQGRPTTLTLLPKDKDIAYRLGTPETGFNKSAYSKLFTTGVKAGSPYKNVARGVVIFGDMHDQKYANTPVGDMFDEWFEPVRKYADMFNIPVEEVPVIGIFTETANSMEPYMEDLVAMFNYKGGNGLTHTIGFAGEINVLAGYGLEELPEIGTFCTVDGEDGQLTFYSGELPYTIIQTDISNMPQAPIPVSMISGAKHDFGNISYRFNSVQHRTGGFALLRAESHYASMEVSPFAYKAISDGTYWTAVEAWIVGANLSEDDALIERKHAKQIEEIVSYKSRAFDSPIEYFENEYRYFLSTAAVYSRGHEAIARACDYKIQEFNKQLGAKYFIGSIITDLRQPAEKVRGAMLLLHPKARFIVESEMKAVKYLRDTMGYKHLHYEYAYVRTQSEIDALDKIAKSVGLEPAEICLMTELATNFVQGYRYLSAMAKKALDAGAYTEEYVSRLGQVVKVAHASCKHGGNDALANATDTDRLAGAYLSKEEEENINNDYSALLNFHRDRVWKETGIYIKLGYCGNSVSLNYQIGIILMTNGYDNVGVTPYNVIKVTYALAGQTIDGEQAVQVVPAQFEVSELGAA